MKTIKLILTASIILLFFVSCEKDQNGNRASFYKTIGEGYIYDGTNNRALKGASITVISCFDGTLLYTPTIKETFYTDENGYYQIRFIKRARDGKVLQYLFRVDSGPMIPPPPPYWTRGVNSGAFPDSGIYPEDIKDKKTITFDTVKFYEKKFN